MPLEALAVESKKEELRLDSAQAETLRTLGRKLASKRAWWGETENTVKSVIEVVSLGDDRYAVTFRDVIGVVKLGQMQIRVLPKISEQHFNYLISKSALAPRVSDSSVALDADSDFATLLALWCVIEAEKLLRHGLRPDYSETSDELNEVRGRLEVVATTIAVQTGRSVAHCEFEEFDDNTPLNRIVKAACQLIAITPDIGPEVRRRARRVALRMASVGALRHGDRHAHVSRLTQSYGRILPLARLLLQGGGLTSRAGSLLGGAFLLRTPELIEDGVRNILKRRLPSIDVRKRRLQLGTSGVTINPDLVFGGGLAVGDVKYRHFSDKWDTSVLYQAVAFAAGFHSAHCGVFGFIDDKKQKVPKEVTLGNITARPFAWNASSETSPSSSEEFLVADVLDWLSGAMPDAAMLVNS